MDMVRTLMADAHRRVSDLERAGGKAGHRPRSDDDDW